jgi:hypothetical protein
MAKRKRTKRNIMLNKTPTREEKIEKNESHQKHSIVTLELGMVTGSQYSTHRAA